MFFAVEWTVLHIFPVCSVVARCQPGAALRDFGHEPLGRDTGHAHEHALPATAVVDALDALEAQR